MTPLYQEISYADPLMLAGLFAQEQGTLFLDSALLMPNCGQYSFLGIDPFGFLISKNGEIFLNEKKLQGDPFHLLGEQLARFKLQTLADLPPFQGGLAGYFAYDLLQHVETISVSQQDDMGFPDLMVGFYDVVIAWDHNKKKTWIFSSGFSFDDLDQTTQAKKRLNETLNIVSQRIPIKERDFYSDINITANFTQIQYCQAVEKVRNYILAGDIFEANISQRFKAELPHDLSPFDLYCRLREINPAPFAAYFKMQDVVLASASPERFLKLEKGLVETRPIKGTRKRGENEKEDARLKEELCASEKDRAENVMIVDLLRNDLSKVCEDFSVQVPQLCGLETYPSVHHLVSVVKGTLQPQYSAVDLLHATFPGGSITGAPKIRAMEIIAEIEPTKRGPYCGSVGYIGFDGCMDTSIIIRTYAIRGTAVTFQAGGAIVLDSDPLSEYEETLTKVKALQRALAS